MSAGTGEHSRYRRRDSPRRNEFFDRTLQLTNIMKITKAMVSALFLFASVSAIQAQESPWFVGVNTGYSWLDHDVYNVNSGIQINRIKDSGGPSFGVEAGRSLCRYFALTGELHDYGSGFAGVFGSTSGPRAEGMLSFPAVSPYKVRILGASVAAMPIWPINDHFHVFAKVGVLFTEFRYSWTDLPHPTERVSNRDLLLGGGVEYSFTKRWSVRLEYEQAQTRLGTLQGGIYWHF